MWDLQTGREQIRSNLNFNLKSPLFSYPLSNCQHFSCWQWASVIGRDPTHNRGISFIWNPDPFNKQNTKRQSKLRCGFIKEGREIFQGQSPTCYFHMPCDSKSFWRIKRQGLPPDPSHDFPSVPSPGPSVLQRPHEWHMSRESELCKPPKEIPRPTSLCFHGFGHCCWANHHMANN